MQVNNLSYQTRQKHIVQNATFTLQPGIYGLLGPNGAGKTTLMRLLADVLIPSSGSILLNGENKQQMGDRYRAQLGYLPQELGMYNHFKGRDFLHFVAVLKGMDKKTAAAEIDRLAAAFHLSEALDQKCGKYSGGMKRRLGLIQAMLNEPAVLILDEPTVGLDPVERIRFCNMLTELAVHRIIILSTHIVSDIDHMATNVLMMTAGQIKQQGTPAEVTADLAGKVWQVQLLADELAQVEQLGTIIHMQQEADRLSVRIVADQLPWHGALLVPPTLEDVYLHAYKPFQA